jgi:hypothetical protein
MYPGVPTMNEAPPNGFNPAIADFYDRVIGYMR